MIKFKKTISISLALMMLFALSVTALAVTDDEAAMSSESHIRNPIVPGPVDLESYTMAPDAPEELDAPIVPFATGYNKSISYNNGSFQTLCYDKVTDVNTPVYGYNTITSHGSNYNSLWRYVSPNGTNMGEDWAKASYRIYYEDYEEVIINRNVKLQARANSNQSGSITVAGTFYASYGN